MSKWWYYTVYKCTQCGATRDEYDHTAPWCDSGLSSCPIIETTCDECFEDLRGEEREHELDADTN